MATRPSQLDRAEVLRRMVTVRAFEERVALAYDQQRVPGTVYLSLGQEAVAATLSLLTADFHVFVQHRCHSVYLAYGGDPRVLRDELLGRDTGCCRGRGGSPSVYERRIGMFPYHGLIGEQIPLAAGYALATGHRTIAYVGDAGVEEDYALGAFGFAATHRLPLLFVCEDNDLSILTPVHVRRGWRINDVARRFGLAEADVEDDPGAVFAAADGLLDQLPALLRVRTCRHRWHAGTGVDGEPVQDRLALFRPTVPQADAIEAEAVQAMTELWAPVLDVGLSREPVGVGPVEPGLD